MSRILYAPGREAEVSSVGVVIHTKPLVPSSDKPYFLLVQQADQEGQPWGIPAGRIELTDQTAMAAAAREVVEETGLVIDLERLELFAWWEKELTSKEPIQAVYSYQMAMKELLAMGDWQVYDIPVEMMILGRSYKAPEILILRDNPLVAGKNEISALALIPAMRLFERGHDIAGRLYRWDALHFVKQVLSARRVI